MNRVPACIVYSQDDELVRRITGYFTRSATVRHADSLQKLEGALERTPETILLIDLRGEGAREALPAVLRARPRSIVIGLGVTGSEPMSEAEAAGAYAVEELTAPRQRLQALVLRAAERLELAQENAVLRQEAADARRAAAAGLDAARREEPTAFAPARRFPGALRPFDKIEPLLEHLVEGVAGSLLVSRAGIFCRARDSETYSLRAGLHCLEDTRELSFSARDPLLHWLTLHAHLVCRDHLSLVRDTAARQLLTQTLDTLGAEALVPLQARERLLGWLFVGHRATGLPFDTAHLESLTMMAEHVSTAIENALLYEEVAVQKTLAETLLHSMPTGIVAVNLDGNVRWFNDAAQQILGVAAEKVLGQRIEFLGSRMADVLRQALREESPEQPVEWMDTKTRRTLAVSARRLMHGAQCLGAVALVQDVTVERMLEEKEEQIERTAFWTELAASMSHEVRNPLVAIKTFAQLLPERYEDVEFRREFSVIVSDEVDRLNRIIDQINDFAHPRNLEFKRIDIRQAIKKGLDQALGTQSKRGIWVDTAIDENLPAVLGDDRALSECFSHVITNAIEALARHENPRIVLSARTHQDGDGPRGVAVSIQDNGAGIPAQIRHKVFSPFCTTKARGMGLGLPIVKRTVIDHNGRVSLDSSEKGTCVTIVLPSGQEKRTP